MKLSTQIVILAVAVMTTIALTFFMYSCAYPLKYKDFILEASEQYDVEPYLVASIINSESSFDKCVVSQKGAVGLMQIMPSTAEWLSVRMGINDYSIIKLYEPQFNINMGTFYLRYLINEQFSTDGKTLVNIPYVETQKYLANVLKNIKFYQNRFN